MTKFKLLAALCFVSFLGLVAANDFLIEGKVYCDTCRAGFETKATYYIAGAKVKVECRNRTNSVVTFNSHGTTDASGMYQLPVTDEREDEICEIVLVESPVKGCAEIRPGRDRARVLLTNNNGIVSNVRFANSLGFLIDTPLPVCKELLIQYLKDNAD